VSSKANMSNTTDSPPHTKEYPSNTLDPENNIQTTEDTQEKESSSAFKALGWLDRLLAVWILLAMIIGILLGNFVPSTGAALEKGKFVGVSVPIGKKESHIPT
jgi:ACR3 family arsenite transporter